MVSLFTAEAEAAHTYTDLQTAQPSINGAKWKRDTHNKIVRATKKREEKKHFTQSSAHGPQIGFHLLKMLESSPRFYFEFMLRS